MRGKRLALIHTIFDPGIKIGYKISFLKVNVTCDCIDFDPHLIHDELPHSFFGTTDISNFQQ